MTEHDASAEPLSPFPRDWPRLLIESLDDPVFLVGTSGTVFDANRAFRELFGPERGIAVGGEITLLAARYPDLADLPRMVREQHAAGGGGTQLEEWHAGRVLHYLFNALPVFPDMVPLVVVRVRDVTSQQQLRQSYHDIQQQLEFTLEKCHIGAWWSDLVDGTIQYTREHNRIYGFEEPVPEWNLAFLRQLIVPEDRERLETMFRERPIGMNGWDLEYRISLRDGAVRWISDVGNVVRNEEGQIVRMMGFSRDITEQKSAEAERLDFQERMDFALSNLMIGVWEYDFGKGKTARTPTHDVIFGYDDMFEGWRFQTFIDHVIPEDLPVVMQANRRMMAEPNTSGLECRIRRRDGQIRWISVVSSPKLDACGRLCGLSGIIQDITDRKLAEQKNAVLQEQLLQAQKMSLVGQLAGGIAHDFNNVLSAIQGNAEMLIRQLDAAHPFFANLESIRMSVNRSAGMVKQLLAFARKQPWSPKVISLDEELGRLRSMLDQLIRADIRLQLEPCSAPAMVSLDPSHLVQIVTNLCINARDAIAGPGAIVIRSSVAGGCDGLSPDGAASEAEWVELSVSDTGCGIDGADLPHVFEPFFTTKENGKGTGLGLAMVYGIVRQNSGTIECVSVPGKGTTITIRFPRVTGMAGSAPDAPEHVAQGRQPMVLLVDDEPEIARVVRMLLEAEGMSVMTAADAEAAIRLFDLHRDDIALVVTEVTLQGMEGFELASRLRGLKPGLKFIFMSAYTPSALGRRSVLTDGVNFIAKPFSVRELLAMVLAALAPGPA